MSTHRNERVEYLNRGTRMLRPSEAETKAVVRTCSGDSGRSEQLHELQDIGLMKIRAGSWPTQARRTVADASGEREEGACT